MPEAECSEWLRPNPWASRFESTTIPRLGFESVRISLEVTSARHIQWNVLRYRKLCLGKLDDGQYHALRKWSAVSSVTDRSRFVRGTVSDR